MMLIGFPCHDRQFDIYRAILLATEIKRENNYRTIVNRKPVERSWIRRKSNEINTRYYQARYGNLSCEALKNISDELNVKLNIWTQNNNNSPLKLSLEFTQECPVLEVNMFSKTFHKIKNLDFSNMDLILKISDFLKKKRFDAEYSTDSVREMTFIQSLTTSLYPNLFGENFHKKVKEMTEKWGKPDFHVRDMRKFYKMFGIGLKLFGHRRVPVTSTTTKLVLDKKYESYWKKQVCLEISGFDANKSVKILQKVKLLGNEAQLQYFECAKKYCFFATHRRDIYEKHLRYCRDEPEIEIKQRVYEKLDESIEEELTAEGILPSATYGNQFFGAFDIESLMSSELGSFSAPGLNAHRLTSIAIATNFSTPRKIFLCRKDMSPEALIDLLKEFVTVIRKLRQQMLELLPASLLEGVEKYTKITSHKDFRFLRPIHKTKARHKLEFLRNLRKLNLYSWNGEKFG